MLTIVNNLLSYFSNVCKKVGTKMSCHQYKIIKTFKSYYDGKENLDFIFEISVVSNLILIYIHNYKQIL